jgi:predicted nucleotidyltransferase
MERDLEIRIAKYLEEKYHPEAIVLHGSRARGKGKENSDWDLDVFVTQPQEGGTEIWEGQALDVDVIALPLSEEELIGKGMYNLRNGKILFDLNGAGEEMVRRGTELFANGRNLTGQEIENRRIRLWRVLRRLQGNADSREIFFYHLGEFYSVIIRYWFELRNRWSEPIYMAQEIISEEDPDFWNLINVLAGDDAISVKLKAAEDTYLSLFKEFPN